MRTCYTWTPHVLFSFSLSFFSLSLFTFIPLDRIQFRLFLTTVFLLFSSHASSPVLSISLNVELKALFWIHMPLSEIKQNSVMLRSCGLGEHVYVFVGFSFFFGNSRGHCCSLNDNVSHIWQWYVTGGLVSQYSRCGRENCHCKRGQARCQWNHVTGQERPRCIKIRPAAMRTFKDLWRADNVRRRCKAV